MAEELFIGREKEREEIARFVAERPKGIIVLQGHTDTGKSALIRKLAKDFEEEGHACGVYRIEAVDDSTRPLIDALAQVVGSLTLKETEGSKGSLVKGMLKNLFSKEILGQIINRILSIF